MKIQRKVLFFPDKEIDKPDAKLRLRIRYGKSLVNFNVGYRIDLAKWIKEAQRCKPGTTHGKYKVSATEINNEIQRLEEIAETIFKGFEIINQVPTPEEFREAFNKANGREPGPDAIDQNSFYHVFDQFIRTEGEKNEWSGATFTKFASIKSQLHDFNPKLSLKDLSEKDLQGFVTYLHSVVIPKAPIKEGKEIKKQYQTGLRNTTIAKTVSFVRWFLRWAFARGFYEGSLHITWKPKFKGTDGNQKEVVHLTWEELMKLYDFKVPETQKHLERVRDVFCFQCFTSLRYSDVAKLKRSDVKPDHINIITQKTVDGLRIDLNDYSKAILDKYKGAHFKDDKALPVISNVKMNVYLKDLGALAGLNERQRIVYFMGNERKEEVFFKHQVLTTHCGRRTFIVNALYLGIPAEVVMRWTGHNDYSAMKPYIKIVDSLKAQEMKKFNRK